MKTTIEDSDEYKDHLPNMPIYAQEAVKNGQDLCHFLINTICVDDDVAKALVKNWNPDNPQECKTSKTPDGEGCLYSLYLLIFLKVPAFLGGLIFFGSGVYIIITKKVGPGWENYIPSGGAPAVMLGVFFILLGLCFFRVLFRNPNSNRHCPSCDQKLICDTTFKGSKNFGFTIKPFSCPHCNTEIILDKKSHTLLFYPLVFLCITYIVEYFLKELRLYSSMTGYIITTFQFAALIIAFFGSKKIKYINY